MNSSTMSPHIPIPAAVLDQAVAWLMRFQEGKVGAKAQMAFDQWLQANALHQAAWKRAQDVLQLFQQVPAGLPDVSLKRVISTKTTRIRNTPFFALFLAFLPLLGFMWRMESGDL